jgi:hypothetical protein
MTGFEEQDVDRERTTARPSTRLLVVYRTETGIWQLTDAPGRVAVDATLADGYRLGKNRDGLPCVVDPSNTFAMTADEAVRDGVLHVPISLIEIGSRRT